MDDARLRDHCWIRDKSGKCIEKKKTVKFKTKDKTGTSLGEALIYLHH